MGGGSRYEVNELLARGWGYQRVNDVVSAKAVSSVLQAFYAGVMALTVEGGDLVTEGRKQQSAHFFFLSL